MLKKIRQQFLSSNCFVAKHFAFFLFLPSLNSERSGFVLSYCMDQDFYRTQTFVCSLGEP